MGEKHEIGPVVTILAVVSVAAVIAYLAMGTGDYRDPGESIAERFHDETSLTPTGAVADAYRPKVGWPGQYKNYPKAKVFKLPKPKHRGVPVEEAIAKRRSVRTYSSQPLSLDQLSSLLFAAQGVDGKVNGRELRTAPSAGGLYPFEVYIVVNNVDGLPGGFYHYGVSGHVVELLQDGSYGAPITATLLKQDMVKNSAVTFILASVFNRTRSKYGERAYRYIYIEAGHISQNIYLQAVSLGLGSSAIGAFFDHDLNRLIGVDGKNEAVIYLHAVGAI